MEQENLVVQEVHPVVQGRQNKKPFAYNSDGNKWLANVQRESELASERLNLFAEMDVMRSAIQEILDKKRPGVQTEEQKVIEDLLKVSANLKDRVADGEELNRINADIDVLVDIYKERDKLTESCKDGLREMSDEKRMQLFARLGEVVGHLGFAQSRMNMEHYIHSDYLKLWAREMWRALVEECRPSPEQEAAWLRRVARIPEPIRGEKK